MLKPLITSGLLCCVVTLSVHAAETADEAVAVVNEQNVTEHDWKKYKEAVFARARQGQGQMQSEADMMQGLIDRELLIQAAKAEGIDQTAEFKRELNTAMGSLLASQILDDYLAKNPVSEEEIQAKYDELVKTTTMPQEYRVSHILSATEEDAKAVLTELQQKGDFAELAKTKSIDAGSAEKGGDLGWVEANAVVPEFATAMQNQKVGELSETPIKSQFGWHIVRVDEVRTMSPPALAV
jgi:peptidyl-prolyl cis-trans isomerase C